MDIQRLSTGTSSSSATGEEFSDDDCSSHHRHPFISLVEYHGNGIPFSVREGDFHCPTMEEVNEQIEMFEKKRLQFNSTQLEHFSKGTTNDWDRKVIRRKKKDEE